MNSEFEELRAGLASVERVLKPGGRAVVLTFQPNEDRIAKEFFHRCSGKIRFEDDEEDFEPTLGIPRANKKVLKPTWSETVEHPRWRSAKMRVGIRTEAEKAVYRHRESGVIERI